MSHRKKILFSARDPGAAGHIKALIHYFCVDDRFEVRRRAGLVSAGAMISRVPALCHRRGECMNPSRLREWLPPIAYRSLRALAHRSEVPVVCP